MLTLTVAHGAAGAAITVAASQSIDNVRDREAWFLWRGFFPLVVFVLLDLLEVPSKIGPRIPACWPCWMARLGTRMRAEARSEHPGQAVGAWIAGFSAVDLVVASWVLHLPSMALAAICFVLSRVLPRFLPQLETLMA